MVGILKCVVIALIVENVNMFLAIVTTLMIIKSHWKTIMSILVGWWEMLKMRTLLTMQWL